jgi:DNA-binding XRE family transcriptional regulator
MSQTEASYSMMLPQGSSADTAEAINSPFMRIGPATPTLNSIFEEYTRWILLPKHVDTLASTLPQLIRRCRELTGWSTRDLAQVIGTSHTTVRMLESEGRVSPRSRNAASRVRPLLGVLSRLHRVAGGQEELALALATPIDTGERVFDLLGRHAWARAFTAGLDVLNGPRTDLLIPQDGWGVSVGTQEMH